jgi:hypothetical protein
MTLCRGRKVIALEGDAPRNSDHQGIARGSGDSMMAAGGVNKGSNASPACSHVTYCSFRCNEGGKLSVNCVRQKMQYEVIARTVHDQKSFPSVMPALKAGLRKFVESSVTA